MLLLPGSANCLLARKLEAKGIPLVQAQISRYPDQEYKIALQSRVRKQHIYVLQSVAPPANDHLIELCLLVNALQRAGASRITAIVPYLGYMREDSSAQMVGQIISRSGIDQLVTLDLHSPQTQKFFTCPLIHLSATELFLPMIRAMQLHNPVIIAPDVGGIMRANKFAELLNCTMIFICKQRGANNTTALEIFGDVQNRDCIIIDDIIDSGNTIYSAAELLKTRGARDIYAFCTHAVLSGNALTQINAVNCKEIMITDTIELKNFCLTNSKLKQVSIASMLAKIIKHYNLSII